MCGVVALLAPIEQSQRESLVQKMCAILGHRGPDGEGIWSGAGITLGHRRLAIIDLSDAAAQPMRRGSFCITYNGEFYNYLSKRSELELRGLSQPWRGQGDTEVLLELASQRGMPAALDELNGMFAFALWDEHEQVLWLARDRFGEKPLYCLLDGATAIVASELKAIVHAARTLGIAIGVERDTLACYLADAEHEVGAKTFIRPIQRVAPGEVWRLTRRPDGQLGLDRRRYYELSPDRCPPSSGPAADARFAELLGDSLRLRLRSDVPVGACLSGGLDSSSLVCLAKQQGHRLKTFSAVHQPGDACDERRYIAAVADHTGVENHQIDPMQLLAPDSFARFIGQHDEPLGGASVWAQHAVYRLIAEHGVHVSLSGQGADECLTGYRGALPALHAELLRRGAWAELRLALRDAQPDAQLRGLLSALRLAARRQLPATLELPWQEHRWRQNFHRRPHFLIADLGTPLPPPPPPHLDGFMRRSLLHGYLYSLLCGSSLATILRYEDRNSMLASVESRAPFLDPRVVEHCLGRPTTELVQHGLTKALLRRALGPLLPELVRSRRDKVGFAAPAERWLLGPLRPLVLDLLDSPTMKQRGLFDTATLARQYQAASAGQISLDSFSLWKALNVELWLRQHRLSL